MEIYKSKVDWWLILILVIDSICILTLIYINFGSKILYIDVLLLIFLVILVWLPLPTTYYVVNNSILNIHSIFLSWEVPLNTIEKVEQISDSLIAPALSLDRIKIKYKKDGRYKSIIISPKNKSEFIKQIS